MTGDTEDRARQHQRIVAALNANDLAQARNLIGPLVENGTANADTYHLLAFAEINSGNQAAAIEALRRSIAEDPRHAGSWSNLGIALRQAGDIGGAIAAYEEALRLTPENKEVLRNLFRALSGREEAAGYLASARAHAGDARNMALALAAVAMLRQAGKAEEAIGFLRQLKAAAASPDDLADIDYQMGLSYAELGREATAEQAFADVLATDPKRHRAHLNYAVRLFRRGAYDGARTHYDRAIALSPDYAEAYFQRGQLRLLHGDFDGGWEDYDWRLKADVFRRHGQRAGGDLPLWTGEPLDGRTLIIHAEQGLGDTIQFLRFVPSVNADGGHVLLEVQDALAPLLHDWSGRDRSLIVSDDDRRHIRASLQLPLMSLARLCRASEATLPGPIPYLRAPADALERWRARLGGRSAERLRIGLVWAGNPHHFNDHNRSLGLDSLAGLLDAIGERCSVTPEFFSLQIGAEAEKLRAAALAGRVQDLSATLTDFGETAAAIETLDLVITVDTSVAHLAGALGRPVFILLAHVPDWRWMLGRATSPWYPSARLFRQQKPGHWGPVIDELAAAVGAFRD